MAHTKKHCSLKFAFQSVLVLLFAILLSGTAWSGGDNPENGPPKGSSLTTLPVEPMATSGSYVTFRTDSGEGLDYYTCGGTVSFTINVTGLDNSTIKSAKLTLAIYDIDYDCSAYWSGPCERDTVAFNGNALTTPVPYLTGPNDQWAAVSFDVDPAWINKSASNTANTIVITVDTLAGGWCMTCDWGELRLEVEKGPTIKEIKITPADTPMTENNVEIEAVVEEVPGYEVVSANFALTDVKKGTVDLVKAVVKNTAPYSFTFKSAAGTHGKKKIACTLTYKNTTTNLTGTDQAEKEFNLFFKRDARTDPTNASSEPNWFKYWRIDGAVPGFDATILYAPVCDPGSTCYGAYDPGTGLISFGPEASGTHYWQAIVLTTFFGNESFGGPTVKGIDCAAEVIAHEGKHKEVKENWDSGVFTEPDSDKVTDNSCIYTHPTDGWHRHCDDRLPDNYEINTSHTLNNTTDTYDLEHEKFGVYKTYGDQEYLCMRAGNGGRGTPEKDWANPGKQTPGGAAAPAMPAKAVPVKQFRGPALAGFSGSYTDTGIDNNTNTY